jgi:hypothetical protein
MKLLDDIIAAHGGLEARKAFTRIEADIVTVGGLFPLKGLEPDPTVRRMTAWLHEERASVTPFGAPDQRTDFTPERIAVEKIDGTLVAESGDPSSLFAGHGLGTAWGPLHRAWFNGYAMWTYLNTPFLLAMDGVEVLELAPWAEGDEEWRVLRAFFPGRLATHSRHQDFYFGPDLMLRRHDYRVDIAGAFAAAQLTGDYIEAEGILLPSRRRAFVRGTDNRPVIDLLMVSIDISNPRLV